MTSYARTINKTLFFRARLNGVYTIEQKKPFPTQPKPLFGPFPNSSYVREGSPKLKVNTGTSEVI